MAKAEDIAGPYIRWLDYGTYEGWKPESFKTLQEALHAPTYGNTWIITKPVKFAEIIENDA